MGVDTPFRLMGVNKVLPGLMPVPDVVTLQTTRRLSDPPLTTEFSPTERHVFMNQIHSGNIVNLDTQIGPIGGDVTVLAADGILTQQTNIVLWVRTADCLPILISHPSGWIAGIHAGRKGTESEIFYQMLISLVALTDSKSGYTVWFGPRICGKCYQIDRVQNRYYDLIYKNEGQLRRVLDPAKNQILAYPGCTACQNDVFFSYRREGPGAGRIFSAVCRSR